MNWWERMEYFAEYDAAVRRAKELSINFIWDTEQLTPGRWAVGNIPPEIEYQWEGRAEYDEGWGKIILNPRR